MLPSCVILIHRKCRTGKAYIIVARLHLVEGIALIGGNTGGHIRMLPHHFIARRGIGVALPCQFCFIRELQLKRGLFPVDLVRHIGADAVGILEQQGGFIRDSVACDGIGSLVLIPVVFAGLGLVGPAPVVDGLSRNPILLFITPHSLA